MHYVLFLLVDCPELGKHAVAVSDYITDRRKSMEPNVLQYLWASVCPGFECKFEFLQK